MEFLATIPFQNIAWMIGVLTTLQTVQKLLEYLADKLDKNPNVDNWYEKFLKYFGLVLKWASIVIKFTTANAATTRKESITKD